jgi:4-hydroxy-3-methylbut-2-enyl diphosphate reductase
VVVYGDERHPEVRGILGWTRGRGQASLSAAIEPEQGEKGLALLAQTTARRCDFAEFASEIAGRHPGRIPEVRVIDTTCPEPARRYEAAQDLARAVEVMVIVGSSTSANTRRLVDVAREAGVPAYSVESAEDIVPDWFLGLEHCGVTAGTSTPAEAVDEVVTRLGTFGEA